MSPIRLQDSKTGLSQKHRAVLFVLLTAVYYLVFFALADTKDTAYFGGDTWEYQSMGVNFAKGHGIQKFGGLEPFDKYKFDTLAPLPELYNAFMLSSDRQNFYRTPAYPLFLGLVYKLFGVSPAIAKNLQLLMLVIIAAALPFIGKRYWGQHGFIGGLLAGGLYLVENYRLAGAILTESMTAFAIFLVIVAFMAYEQRHGFLAAILLGLSLGFAPLVKGTLFFLPILTGILILIRTIRNKGPNELIQLFVITASAMLIVVPWTAYMYMRTGAVIILATQGGPQLLADNTEFCADGRWHPEWTKKKDSFYNTDGIPGGHVVTKVVNFYWHHPAMLPRCMAAKFAVGFGPLPFLWSFVAFVLLADLKRIANCRLKSDAFKVVCFSALLSLSVVACVAVYHFSQPANIDRWIVNGWWLPKLAPIVLTGWLVYLMLTERVAFRIPTAFWVISVNFLLITLVFHAEPSSMVGNRLVAPMDFLLALVCCVAAVSFFSESRFNWRPIP